MDKEEFRVKLEEINHLVDKKDYKGAMKVVDSIDWRRVKNVRTLCTVGEIYAVNKRYDESKEIFLLAYHRAPIGKNILYRLLEVSLKMGDIEDAKDFYQEYKDVAPHDSTLLILKYKILSAKKAPIAEQIKVLEEYKEREFTEKWSYELARLYYQSGDKKKCLDICDEMILWFHEGTYVMRALDLKMRMGALTQAEKERYEQQFVPKLLTPEDAQLLKEEGKEPQKEEKSEEHEYPEIETISVGSDRDLNGVESLQEKISKGIRDIFGKREEPEDEAEEDLAEEMIRKPSDRELENAPSLEAEGVKAVSERPADYSKVSVEVPKLEIPESMKNFEAEKTPELKIEEGAEPKETSDFQINLEDRILAAASAQGIQIPGNEGSPAKEAQKAEEPEEVKPKETKLEEPEFIKENIQDDIEENIKKPEKIKEIIKEPEETKGAKLEEPEFIKETIKESEVTKESPKADEDSEEIKTPEEKQPVQLEEEEFLSEEDLRAAEEEFLNGPKKPEKPVEAAQEPEPAEPPVQGELHLHKKKKTKVIPRLEDEEIAHVDYEEEKKPKKAVKRAVALKAEEEEASGAAEEPTEAEEAAAVPEEQPLSEEEKIEQFIDSIQPKEERDPLDLIPRERVLTEEEKQHFNYFVKVPGMKEQLLDALCDAQMAAADKTSRSGNIIVMGGKETGKTRLIGSLVPLICKERNIEASKVAYVFAEQINGMDMKAVVSKLSGGFLVIENANQLDAETVKELDRAMDFRTNGLTVIIEDEKIGMRKFLARYPRFAKKFTSMINIPVFTNDELVNFARVYTKENGYRIDQMGMLALYNLIGINQKEDEPMNVGAVKELVDNAVARSQGGLLKLNKKKRIDRDGYIVLHEKDFAK